MDESGLQDIYKYGCNNSSLWITVLFCGNINGGDQDLPKNYTIYDYG